MRALAEGARGRGRHTRDATTPARGVEATHQDSGTVSEGNA
jgi:hypothetical protein